MAVEVAFSQSLTVDRSVGLGSTDFLINVCMCSRKAVSGLKSRVNDAGGSIHPWLKPFDHRMCFFDVCKLEWLGLVFVSTLAKFETETPK